MAQTGGGHNTQLMNEVLPIFQASPLLATVFADMSVPVPGNFGIGSVIRIGALDPDAKGVTGGYDAATGTWTEPEKANFLPIDVTMDKVLDFQVKTVITDENYQATFEQALADAVVGQALGWDALVLAEIERVVALNTNAGVIADKDNPLDWTDATKLIKSFGRNVTAYCDEKLIPAGHAVCVVGPTPLVEINNTKQLTAGTGSVFTNLNAYAGQVNTTNVFKYQTLVGETNNAGDVVYPIYFGYDNSIRTAALPLESAFNYWPAGSRPLAEQTVYASGLFVAGLKAAYTGLLFKAYVKLDASEGLSL